MSEPIGTWNNSVLVNKLQELTPGGWVRAQAPLGHEMRIVGAHQRYDEATGEEFVIIETERILP